MFEKVLVGVDGRSGGRDAIMLARLLAAAHSQVVLANVYGEVGMSGAGGLAIAAARDDARALLTRERRAASLEAETVARYHGAPGRALHEIAEHESADLLVVGSRHRGRIGRVLMGDDTIDALNGAPCAVAIAPRGYASEPHRLRAIGVGHDGSPESELALKAARSLAQDHQAAIRALAVVPLQSVPTDVLTPLDWTDETERVIAAERVRMQTFKNVDGSVVYGDPSAELAAFGAEVDLLVVGSRGYGPLGRLFNGSTSTYLARHTSCPLLVLPRVRQAAAVKIEAT
jgi:nucleotide-binding universal stress UspA family protein